ncbi:MAG: CRISPR-associated protein Cas5 [Aquificae bacterium]|nr:CRISPR-associated protein Cas5 [Aquificota bacterium]
MIRLHIRQETAHFRIPTIGSPCLSYPLPPPSTIYGFLRAVTDYKSINPTNTYLSIQGYFKAVSFEKERLIEIKTRETTTNVIPIQKFHQCEWVVHVKSPYEEEIVRGIENTNRILRLGRREDLVIDIEVKTNLAEEKLNKGQFDKIRTKLNRTTKIWKPWKLSLEELFEENADRKIYQMLGEAYQPLCEGNRSSVFRVPLDSRLENGKIVEYVFVNLMYTSTSLRFPSFSKLIEGECSVISDGEYLIDWIGKEHVLEWI